MKNEKSILFILATIQFINIVDFMIIMPLGPQLMRIFEINPKEFSVIVSSYTISAGISGFVSAFFLDRFDRKKVLLLIFSGFTIGTFLSASSNTYLFLTLSRMFTGLFGGILSATVFSIIGDIIPFERRGAAMGIVMAAFSVASVIGIPIGLYLAELMNWKLTFYSITMFAIILFSLIVKVIPSINKHLTTINIDQKPLMVLKRIIEKKDQLKALSLMALMILGQFSVITFINPYLVSNVGFSDLELSYVYFFGGVLTIFSSQVIGRLSDRFGQQNTFVFVTILSLIPLILITHMQETPLILALFYTSLFMILISGRMIPAMTIITSTVLAKNRGSFMSVNSSVQQMFSGISSFIAGLIIIEVPETKKLMNYDWVGYIAVFSSILAIILVKKINFKQA